jgi:hypothetical protein
MWGLHPYALAFSRLVDKYLGYSNDRNYVEYYPKETNERGRKAKPLPIKDLPVRAHHPNKL